jgi:hypothetical protein
MALSGSYDYSANAGEIVTLSLRTLGVLAEDEAATASQMNDGLKRLNMMLKAWRARGISLPLYQELTVYLQAGKQSYLLGATGDKATATPYKTELAADAASGAGSVTVDSASDFTNGDNVGIVQDDNTILWTTGTKSGSVITLGTTLTAAASTDNHVYFYTTIAQRPLTVKGARLKINDGNETPVRVITRQEYFDYNNKSSQGKINAVYYDPQITNGVLYTYLTADSVSDTLNLTVQRQLSDLDATTDDFDFPIEWMEPIYMNLCLRMLTKYGI